jgi:hypothetical protein
LFGSGSDVTGYPNVSAIYRSFPDERATFRKAHAEQAVKYETIHDADPGPRSSGAGIDATAGQLQQHQRVYWLLLILFAALQIADIVTTNYALATPGVWEANPLMALLQARLGAAWWLPKLGVAGCVCLATPLLQRRWPMILTVSYYTVIVSINLVQL